MALKLTCTLLALATGCTVAGSGTLPPAPAAVVANAPPPPRRPSGCREDIPDCVAACALRETSRTDYLDWFDQRCAAVILGRNPDRVAGTTPAPPPRQSDLLDTR